jgi:hypothetical protein
MMKDRDDERHDAVKNSQSLTASKASDDEEKKKTSKPCWKKKGKRGLCELVARLHSVVGPARKPLSFVVKSEQVYLWNF